MDDPQFLAVHQEPNGALVPRHAIDGLPELTAAIERLAAAFEPPQDSPVWPTPTRFDPDDRSTWPEDGQRVLILVDDAEGGGETDWVLVSFWNPTDPYCRWASDDLGAPVHANADLWLPLPPTPGQES